MKFTINVRGDINDADYTEKSHTVDFDDDVFKGWTTEEGPPITWNDVLTAFAESIREYEAKKDKENCWYCNWSDEAQEVIFASLAEKLKSIRDLSVDYYYDLLWDILPGTCDYPMHTILNITATPAANTVTYF